MKRSRLLQGTPTPRRGVAAIWALVVLSVLTVVIALATWHSLAGQRLAERRQYQLQADWLARSGIELAAARLLTAPHEYKGETVQPVERGQVRIAVHTDEKAPGVFRITAEARYPAGDKDAVLRTAARTLRRVTEKGQVRLANAESNP